MASTMDQDGPDPDDGWKYRVLMWLGHYNVRITVATLGTAIPISLIVDLAPLSGWLSRILSVTSIVLIAVFLVCNPNVLYHDRHLCQRHLAEVPLSDPDGAVERYDRQLHAYHHANSTLHVVVAVGCYTAMTAGLLLDRIPLSVAMIPVDGLMAASIYFGWRANIHNRLQPWCPYCRDNGDDDGFQPVDPTNPPAVRRPKPVSAS